MFFAVSNFIIRNIWKRFLCWLERNPPPRVLQTDYGIFHGYYRVIWAHRRWSQALAVCLPFTASHTSNLFTPLTLLHLPLSQRKVSQPPFCSSGGVRAPPSGRFSEGFPSYNPCRRIGREGKHLRNHSFMENVKKKKKCSWDTSRDGIRFFLTSYYLFI